LERTDGTVARLVGAILWLRITRGESSKQNLSIEGGSYTPQEVEGPKDKWGSYTPQEVEGPKDRWGSYTPQEVEGPIDKCLIREGHRT
jgi:hypothetical protein